MTPTADAPDGPGDLTDDELKQAVVDALARAGIPPAELAASIAAAAGHQSPWSYLWRRALGPAVVSGIVFVLVTMLLRVVVDGEAFGDALPISAFGGAAFALTFGGLTVLMQRARQKR